MRTRVESGGRLAIEEYGARGRRTAALLEEHRQGRTLE